MPIVAETAVSRAKAAYAITHRPFIVIALMSMKWNSTATASCWLWKCHSSKK